MPAEGFDVSYARTAQFLQANCPPSVNPRLRAFSPVHFFVAQLAFVNSASAR